MTYAGSFFRELCVYLVLCYIVLYTTMSVFYAPIRSLLVFLSWYAAYHFLLSLTVKYGIMSKFRICHTFPFGSVIILGLLLEIDIVVKTCGLKYAMLLNPLLGKGST